MSPVFTVLCAALLGLATAAPLRAQTLARAVERAFERFPEFRAGLANRRAQAELVGQARGSLFPSVDLSLGAGRERSDNATTRALGQELSLERREAELTVSQLLFDGGVAAGQLRRFEARADGAALQVADAAEALALRVALAYLEVLRLRGQLEIALQNAATHQRTLEQIELLVKGGAGRISDAQQATARLALAQASVAQLRGQVEQAESAYRHLVGDAPGKLRAPQVEPEKLPPSVEAALAQTLAAHPSVRAAEREVEAAQAERESARARLVPRLNLELGVSRNRDVDGVRGPNEDRFAMLRLRANLFRGGADEARVREAVARFDEARAGLARTRNDAERDLRQAWQGLRAGRERMPNLALHARSSAQVVEAYRKQFQIGQRSLLDLLNSEAERYGAQAAVLNGVYAVSADEHRLLAAMGKLVAALGVPRPWEAEAEDAAAR